MSGYLLSVAVGPVQGFIAAARRTRDLWCGSLILSELSKAVARELASSGAQLIFPSLTKDAPELDPYPYNDFNVANIIVAEVPEDLGIPTEELAYKSKAAAQERWVAIAEEALKGVRAYIHKDRWERQVHDVIEFYAAWCPLVKDDYEGSRARLKVLMDARKECRDFLPALGESGVPKSSLDGERESVLKFVEGEETSNRKIKSRLRLSEGEQLDSVGLTKRLGFEVKSYPSVSRIAVDPWVRGLAKTSCLQEKFSRIRDEICVSLCREKVLNQLKDYPQYREFQYDGAILYPNRHQEFLEEAQADEAIAQLLGDVRKALKLTVGLLGEPDPYLAVLVADGDHVGKLLSGMTVIEEHRRFSKKLAEFASIAKSVVEDRKGCLVYSGGDDVLALVPLDQCLECADQLQSRFHELLSEFGNGDNTPTLSVGIAVGHCLDTLEHLLAYGRKAEEDAKRPDRNGLAIHVHSRGGAPLRIRGRWDTGIYYRLMKWIELHCENKISDTAGYNLQMLAKDYSAWKLAPAETESAIKSDVTRLLKRKRPGGQAIDVEDMQWLKEGLLFDATREDRRPEHLHREVERLAKELIVARRLAHAVQQARGFNSDPERKGA